MVSVPEKRWSGSGSSRLVVGTLVQVGRVGSDVSRPASIPATSECRMKPVFALRRQIQLIVEIGLRAVHSDLMAVHGHRAERSRERHGVATCGSVIRTRARNWRIAPDRES